MRYRATLVLLERKTQRRADFDGALRVAAEEAHRPRRYGPLHAALLDQLDAELGGDREVARLEIRVAESRADVGIERAAAARAECLGVAADAECDGDAGALGHRWCGVAHDLEARDRRPAADADATADAIASRRAEHAEPE